MNLTDKFILGINDTHDASAALVKNGKIICAISEERVQRIKSTGGYPKGCYKCLFKICKNKNERHRLYSCSWKKSSSN